MFWAMSIHKTQSMAWIQSLSKPSVPISLLSLASTANTNHCSAPLSYNYADKCEVNPWWYLYQWNKKPKHSKWLWFLSTITRTLNNLVSWITKLIFNQVKSWETLKECDMSKRLTSANRRLTCDMFSEQINATVKLVALTSLELSKLSPDDQG